MMNGYWQQSLTLCAQLLFALAVNPHVEPSKQKNTSEYTSWRERFWAWHKVKAIVDSIGGIITITNTDWESICRWIFCGDNVCRSHAAAEKSSEGEASAMAEVQAVTFRIPSSLNDQVTSYWSQPSFKAKNLKPCVTHSMTCGRK